MACLLVVVLRTSLHYADFIFFNPVKEFFFWNFKKFFHTYSNKELKEIFVFFEYPYFFIKLPYNYFLISKLKKLLTVIVIVRIIIKQNWFNFFSYICK